MVVSDSNRRRRFVPEFGHQNLGATLPADEPLDENFALIEPFPERGSDAQTVAALDGARYLRAPSSGGLLEFPEHAAIAAFDGDPSTVWAADRYLQPSDALDRDRLRAPARRALRRPAAARATGAGSRRRSTSTACARRSGPGATASGWTSRTWTSCA